MKSPVIRATRQRNNNLVAPGTGFFVAETGASIRPDAPTGTQRPQAEIKKARQWRAKLASLHKGRDIQTGWWRTQSHSNLSPRSNSLLTGKLTGNFAKFGPPYERKVEDASKSNGLRRNSLRSRTGNFCERTGNLCARAGNMNRDIQRRHFGREIQLATKQHSLGVKSDRATSAKNIPIACRMANRRGAPPEQH
jgi:hypothetical protein